MNDDEGLDIRTLGGNDIGALQSLVGQFVRSHPCLPFKEDHWDAFRQWLSNTSKNVDALCLLAKLNGCSVGLIVGDIRQTVPLFTPARIGHVSVLIVDDKHRTKGIGGALWHAMRNWFVSRGIDHFELYTEHGNPVSGPFWAARGFEVYLEKRRRYP